MSNRRLAQFVSSRTQARARPGVRLLVLPHALLFATIAATAQADEPLPLSRPLLVPSTVQYQWTFAVPAIIVETRDVVTRVYAPSWRSARIDVPNPEIETRQRRIGSVPEFSCKYFDGLLPNACTTTWRGVYVDLPVPVVRRDHVDVEVPGWAWRDVHTRVEVPRVIWSEQTMTVSVPAWQYSSIMPKKPVTRRSGWTRRQDRFACSSQRSDSTDTIAA